MSENEQEVVPVKLAEVAEIFKSVSGEKYAVHVVMNEPPPITFEYCFHVMGLWLAASAVWAFIIGMFSGVVALVIALISQAVR